MSTGPRQPTREQLEANVELCHDEVARLRARLVARREVIRKLRARIRVLEARVQELEGP